MNTMGPGERELLMALAGDRKFKLHLRCESCLATSTRVLSVPRVEDAPVYVDELMESAALQNLPFHCGRCDSMIGHVVAVTGGD